MFKLLLGLYQKLAEVLLTDKSKQRLVKDEENQVVFISKIKYIIIFHSFWFVQFKEQPRIRYYFLKGRMRILACFAPFSKWTGRFCGWISCTGRARECPLLWLLVRSDCWLLRLIPILPPSSPHLPYMCKAKMTQSLFQESFGLKSNKGNPRKSRIES